MQYKKESIVFLTEKKDICVGIINSLSNEDNKFVKEHSEYFDLILIDECHKLGAKGYNNILMLFGKAKFMIGLSATPDRQDKKH